MDRLDEELAEADIVHRDPDAVQTLLDNYGKGFSKFLNEVIKFHEKENAQESENTKNIAKVYSSLRFGLQNTNKMPLRLYFESTGTELCQWINSLDERRSIEAQRALEDLKKHRIQYANKCKLLKEQWKAMKTKYVEAREAHRISKANYYRMGRELEKMKSVLSEESGSFGSSDILDHISSSDGGGSAPGPTMSKRDRQRMQQEAKFVEAEKDYREAVLNFRMRITQRTKTHMEKLATLKQAAMEADSALLQTEHRLLRLARDQASSMVAKIDNRLTQIKDYRPGACYNDWASERLSAPPVSVEDEASIVFVPFSDSASWKTDSMFSSSCQPTSPTVVPRNHPAREFPSSPQLTSIFEPFSNRRSADPLLESKRDSVDGSSDGSTPGSSRRSHFRSSEEIGGKTPGSTPTEEEIRASTAMGTQASAQSGRVSWFQKTFKWWTGAGARTSSLGWSSGSSPPPIASPSLEDELHVIKEIVAKCVAALDKTGLTTEGLYRKAASEAKTRDIINDMFYDVDGVSLDELPPLAICTVIKKCFIKLRDPLFTEALNDEFLQIGLEPDADGALENLKKVIDSLPAINFEIAASFMRHLNKVAMVEENQMNFENLGTCLAPTLFHQRTLYHCMSLPAKNSKELLSNTQVKEFSRVLSMIIEHVDFLFRKEDTEPATSIANPSTNLIEGSVTETSSTVTCQIVDGGGSSYQVIQTHRKEAIPLVDGQAVNLTVDVPMSGSTQRTAQVCSQFSPPTVPSSVLLASKDGSVGTTESVISSGSSFGVGPASGTSSSQMGRSEDSPPPVPPALGRRKHFSNDRSPASRKVHEITLRNRLSSSNSRSCNSDVFDDRLLLADVYSGSGRPSAFQMIDSSVGTNIFNLFRRNKSLDDGIDLDKSFSHGYGDSFNGHVTLPRRRSEENSNHPNTDTSSCCEGSTNANATATNACTNGHAPPHRADPTSQGPAPAGPAAATSSRAVRGERRVFIENGISQRRRGSWGDAGVLYRGLGPPPVPPPKPDYLKLEPGAPSPLESSSSSSTSIGDTAALQCSAGDPRRRFQHPALRRRQSEPAGITLVEPGSGRLFADAPGSMGPRSQRSNTVTGNPNLPPGSSSSGGSLLRPLRSRPEFV